MVVAVVVVHVEVVNDVLIFFRQAHLGQIQSYRWVCHILDGLIQLHMRWRGYMMESDSIVRRSMDGENDDDSTGGIEWATDGGEDFMSIIGSRWRIEGNG